MGKSKAKEMISFDVLLGNEKPDVPATPATMKQMRPSADAAQRTLRWLEQHGVRCHDLEYSLACQAPRTVFEKLFAVSLKQKKTPGGPTWEMSASPTIPPEIASWVRDVTIAPPPVYFA